MGCEAVTEQGAAASAAGAPAMSGMLSPTRNMNVNEMQLAARASPAVSMWRWRRIMPSTKAGSSTSMWMLFSGP